MNAWTPGCELDAIWTQAGLCCPMAFRAPCLSFVTRHSCHVFVHGNVESVVVKPAVVKPSQVPYHVPSRGVAEKVMESRLQDQ